MARAHIERLPPQDIEAEESTLGGCLIDQEQIDRVRPLLRARDFYREKNGWIYQAMLDLHESHVPVDFITLCEILERRSQLDVVGGREYLTSLLNAVPTATHTRHYANIVKDKATRRQVAQAGARIVGYGYDEDMELGTLLSTSRAELQDIHVLNGNIVTMKQHVSSYFETQTSKTANAGIMRSGIPYLDRMVRLHKGEMMTLAGRPRFGKSALAINMTINMARQGIGVAFCSIEMASDTVVHRMVSQIARLPARTVDHFFANLREEGPPVSDEQANKINTALSELQDLPIFLTDDGTQTLNSITDFVSSTSMMHHVQAVFVDHLQKIAIKDDDPVQAMTKISGGLVAMARDHNLWLIALSQLSRQSESRGYKDGMMVFQLSDLRGSGSIEQDSSVIIFLNRPHLYNKAKFGLVPTPLGDSEQAWLEIRKNRNGDEGDIRTLFIPSMTLYLDATDPEIGGHYEGGHPNDELPL